MYWNFQSVKSLDNLWNNMKEEKEGVEKQNSMKGLEKNEHACSVEGVCGLLIALPIRI